MSCSGVVALVEDGAASMSDSWTVCARVAFGSGWVGTSGVKGHVTSGFGAAWIVGLVEGAGEGDVGCEGLEVERGRGGVQDCTECSYADAELRNSWIEVVCNVDQEYGELIIRMCYTITL